MGFPPKSTFDWTQGSLDLLFFFEGNGGFPRVIKLPIFFGGGSNKQQIYGHFEEFPLKNDALGFGLVIHHDHWFSQHLGIQAIPSGVGSLVCLICHMGQEVPLVVNEI